MKARKILIVSSVVVVVLAICAIVFMACKDHFGWFAPADQFANVERVIKEEISYGVIIENNGEAGETDVSDTNDNDVTNIPVHDKNPVNDNWTLCVPTDICYYDGLYFIVDCYNNRIIYSDVFEKDLYEWRVIGNDLNQPHTICSDGNVYLVDDTENNRVMVYKKGIDSDADVCFYVSQIFNEIGNRPHYIYYNEADSTFYAWSSESGEMFLFRYMEEQDLVALVEKRIVPEISGVYIRSFTIRGDSIYFVSNLADANIYQCNLATFKVEKKYKVSEDLAGMVQITFCEDAIIITVSTDREGNISARNLILCKCLEDLEQGNYVSYYDDFATDGTPYNVTKMAGDVYYVTVHTGTGTEQIISFQVEGGAIVNIQKYF